MKLNFPEMKNTYSSLSHFVETLYVLLIFPVFLPPLFALIFVTVPTFSFLIQGYQVLGQPLFLNSHMGHSLLFVFQLLTNMKLILIIFHL